MTGRVALTGTNNASGPSQGFSVNFDGSVYARVSGSGTATGGYHLRFEAR